LYFQADYDEIELQKSYDVMAIMSPKNVTKIFHFAPPSN